jgi:hypothetical protein
MKKNLGKNISLDFNLFILDMAKKKTDKFSTWKKKKPLERKVADELVKKSELNDKLRDKQIGTSFLDLF